MPIDGITFKHPIVSFKAYNREIPIIEWVTPKNSKTGLPAISITKFDKKNRYKYITIIHTAVFEGLKLKANEVFRTSITEDVNTDILNYQCELEVSGSIHKHFFGNNSGLFRFVDLQDAIRNIAQKLSIDPATAIIENIEVGLILALNFPPDILLGNLLTYKGNTFNRYRDERIGRYCPLKADFEIKVYNKGFQENLAGNIIRYEVHYRRMRALNALGITHLNDLQNIHVIFPLINLIDKIWDNVLIYPENVLEGSENLTANELDFLKKCRAPQYWSNLYKLTSRTNIKKQRDKLRKLDKTTGANIHYRLGELTYRTWLKMFNVKEKEAEIKVTFVPCTQLQKQFESIENQQVIKKEAETRVTFVPNLKEVCENGSADEYNKHINDESSLHGNESTIKIKETNVTNLKMVAVCKTCGKPLNPKQKKGSVFCSEKYTDKLMARQCRNYDSNKRKKESKILVKSKSLTYNNY